MCVSLRTVIVVLLLGLLVCSCGSASLGQRGGPDHGDTIAQLAVPRFTDAAPSAFQPVAHGENALDVKRVVRSSANCSVTADGIRLASVPGEISYVIYGLSGLNDNSPREIFIGGEGNVLVSGYISTLELTAKLPDPSATIYVGESDQAHNRWIWNGPLSFYEMWTRHWFDQWYTYSDTAFIAIVASDGAEIELTGLDYSWSEAGYPAGGL